MPPTNQLIEGCGSPCGWTGYYSSKNSRRHILRRAYPFRHTCLESRTPLVKHDLARRKILPDVPHL
ncbi:hypothetical protein TorRG33x02_049800, partial [Trema orientale]